MRGALGLRSQGITGWTSNPAGTREETMSNVTVCDVCNREIKHTTTYKPITAEVKRDNTVKRVIDLHEKCYGALLHWLAECRENSAKFKDVG